MTPLAVDKPVAPAGDTPHDDATRGLRYPSDFVPRKPFGEVIVVGTAYPPAERTLPAYPVRVAVGSWWKEITVHGDRNWVSGGLFDVPGPAGVADALPLTFAHAFGGARVAANPLGFGFRGGRVPNFELSARPITGRRAAGDPAGFGAIPPDWPQRRQHAGMPGNTRVSSWWPWSPPQFDECFWMATLPDQWVEGYFQGDEPVELLHLHPEHAEWRTSLPGKRARVFVLRLPDDAPLSSARRGRLVDAGATFEEVPLVLDTVFIDTDALEMTLVWRGSTPVRSPKLRDILGVSFGLEPLAEHRDPEHYLAMLLADETEAVEPAPDGAAIRAEIEAAIAAGEAKRADVTAIVDAQMARLRADVAAELVQTRARHAAAIEGLVATLGPDLEAVARVASAASMIRSSDPFDAPIPLDGPSMAEFAADLRRQAEALSNPTPDAPAAMREALVETAGIRSKALCGSADELEKAAALQAGFMDDLERFKQEILHDVPPGLLAKRVIEPGEPLDVGAIRRDGLADYDLRGVDFSDLDLAGVSFRGVNASGARFRRTRLVNADFTNAILRAADLADADASMAVFEGADFADAIVVNTRLANARIGAANFRGLDLRGLDFSGVSGRNADFSNADLSSALFCEAHLERPTFTGGRMSGADFSRASLGQADFGGASCRGAIFDDASLPNIRAREAADFSGARLHRAKADDATWTTSLLDGADFQDADLRRADFSECSLDGTNFDRCDLANAVFTDSLIHRTFLTNANLFRTSFDRATIVEVRFDGSSLFEVGFWDASLTDVSMQGCAVGRTTLPAAETAS